MLPGQTLVMDAADTDPPFQPQDLLQKTLLPNVHAMVDGLIARVPMSAQERADVLDGPPGQGRVEELET